MARTRHHRPKARTCPRCGAPVRRSSPREWSCTGCPTTWLMGESGSPEQAFHRGSQPNPFYPGPRFVDCWEPIALPAPQRGAA
jgi:hypothetical protein